MLQQGDPTRADGAVLLVVFSAGPVGPTDSILDLFSRGGAVVKQEMTTGNNVDVVVGVAGPRASRVEVGDVEAALIHSDELAPGLRTWGLYWSDGVVDFSIETTTSAWDAVTAGRGIVCADEVPPA